MKREWKPGDVATVDGFPIVFFEQRGATYWTNRYGYQYRAIKISDAARPLVVIDPEDREAVDRFREVFRALDCLPGDSVDDWQAALREFADPKPAEVYEHFVANGPGNATKQSLCGKVWATDDRAVSAGRCPTCVSLVKDGWSK